MTCGNSQGELIELARGGRLAPSRRSELLRHIDECRPCGEAFDAQHRLSEAAAALAAEAATISLPSEPDAALLDCFARVRGRRPRRVPYGVMGALAASLLLSFMGIAWFANRPRQESRIPEPHSMQAGSVVPPPSIATPVKTLHSERIRRRRAPPAPSLASTASLAPALAAAAEPEQPFVSIPYTAPLADWERTDIVRVNLPVAALIAAGFPFQTSDAGARANADLVVGEDGRARAVRLISISSSRF